MRKIIIAGGRDFDDYNRLEDIMFAYTPCTIEVACGLARGADAVGKCWAEEEGVKIRLFPADWDTWGKAAGHIRNREMAKYADVLVAFWDGKSKGTKGMIDVALELGLEVHVFRYGVA